MQCKCGEYISNGQTICEKCKERRNTKSVHKYLKEGNYGIRRFFKTTDKVAKGNSKT